MSGIFFVQLLWCAVEMAFLLSTLESESTLVVWVSILAIPSVMLPTFFYCKLSENLTTDLAVIGDAFYDCAWFNLLAKQQEFFLMPIQRAQIEFRCTGLGIVDCSLRIFLSVNHIFAKFD